MTTQTRLRAARMRRASLFAGRSRPRRPADARPAPEFSIASLRRPQGAGSGALILDAALRPLDADCPAGPMASYHLDLLQMSYVRSAALSIAVDELRQHRPDGPADNGTVVRMVVVA